MRLLKKITLFLLLIISIPVFTQDYETEFQSRSQTLVTYLADSYKADASGWYNCNSPSDYGKYNWQIAVACFHKYGVTNAKGNTYLTHFDTPTCLVNRFHFNLMGETFIFSKYWGAPSVKSTIKNYLTAAWNRNDSHNLLTSEGTENHIAMTRPAAYIYAQIARDSFPADFPNAQQKLDSAKLWITDWAKTMYTSGVGEWNSSTYEPYSIVGWLALYEGAKDVEVRNVAHAVLDYYACEMALHYTQGIVGGYESRNSTGYESNITTSDYLSWLWFGDSPRLISWTVGSMNTEAAQSVYAAVSSYRPPKIAVQLAKKQLTKNAMYYNSKGEYLLNNPGEIKQTFYIGKTYTLGAAYLPYGGFGGGDAQFQVWKFVGKIAPNTAITAKTANTIVGYGSSGWNKARGRNPWDQVVHHKNVLIQMTKVPTNGATLVTQALALFTTWSSNWSADFSKRFPLDGKGSPVTSATIVNVNKSYIAVWKKNNIVTTATNNNIAFFEMDSNYVAIRSLVRTAPRIGIVTDNFDVVDSAAVGNLCGLVLEVGSKLEYSSFADFQSKIISLTSLNKAQIGTDKISYTSAFGDVIDVQFNAAGTFTEPLFDWGKGPITKQLLQKSPPFIQPTWPTGAGHGRVASWSVNAVPLDMTNSKWAVYEGPHFSLKNSILRLYNGTADSLRIDYTGTLPVYVSLTTNNNNIRNNVTIKDLKIYPNPASQLLNVEFESELSGSYTVELMDLSGKSILTQSNQKNAGLAMMQMQLRESLRGMYILKIKCGNSTLIEKLQIK